MRVAWTNTQLHKPAEGTVRTVTLIPGIGIGPEITSK
jgi:isocitrate dehydrogenase (NAD+)